MMSPIAPRGFIHVGQPVTTGQPLVTQLEISLATGIAAKSSTPPTYAASHTPAASTFDSLETVHLRFIALGADRSIDALNEPRLCAKNTAPPVWRLSAERCHAE